MITYLSVARIIKYHSTAICFQNYHKSVFGTDIFCKFLQTS